MKFKHPYIDLHKKPHKLSLIATILVAIIFAFGSNAEPKRNNKANIGAKQEFTVVIDAGHGGHDHGASENGAREKDINLGVAKKFAQLASKKIKNLKVVLTRDDDTFISLQNRADIANRNRADLFVSIHTNSVDKSNKNRKNVAGASVYALGPQKDANNLKVAQRENSVIELEDNYHQKYSGFDPSKDESYIIFEMAQKKNLGQSLKFAEKVQKELVSTAGRKDRGVKQAGFWVLWATSMPSVLVELDFICNPEVANYLASDKGQQQLAEALVNALDSYVKAYRNPTAENTTTPTPSPFDTKVADDPTENTPSETDYSGINTLVAQNDRTNSERKHVVSNSNTGNTAKARRRRSDVSRRASDTRNHETGTIELRSETDYLAKPEEKETIAETDPVADQEKDNKNNKNNKKNKKKDKAKTQKKNKDNKETVKDKNKKQDKKKDTQGNTSNRKDKKTFVVRKTSQPTEAKPVEKAEEKQTQKQPATTKANAESAADTHSARPVLRESTEAVETFYTIQLLASEKKIDTKDPVFCGIIPTDMFIENGLHKYTYGAYNERHEIEEKLLEVKTRIPDAFIIVRAK